MKHVLAFGASTSSTSINVQLARWSVARLDDVSVDFIDLNDFEMPIFSVDREAADGIPEPARLFKKKIQSTDGILISFAEHNGSYSAAFKNIFDWTSRVERAMWENKPMLLMATSPGKRGGRAVLEHAATDFPHRGGQVIAHFSLPSFKQTFDASAGIQDPYMLQSLNKALNAFKDAL